MATTKVKAVPSASSAARARVREIRVNSKSSNSVAALREQVSELADAVELLADAVENLERRNPGQPQG